MNNRNESLDALRGLAILAMILSGSIAYSNIMPAWMFHAQVPPPNFTFMPTVYGITWVDLVFPFFLFSMGAAIPLALHKIIQQNNSTKKVLTIAFKRFALLAFFAIFSEHMRAWVIANNPTEKEQLQSIFAFILLFFQFYENKKQAWNRLFLVAKVLSFIIAIVLLVKLPFWNGKGVDLYGSDIIIMVLANMAFFATLIYYFTRNNYLWRIAILPFVMAVFLASKETENGWAKTLFNFSAIANIKFDWLYKFYFLKYLFIVIPGTLAGEMMLNNPSTEKNMSKKNEHILVTLLTVLLVVNLYCLLYRHLFINLIITVCLGICCWYILKNIEKTNLLRKYFIAGSYLLLLGLFFEAYEGGIRKDFSTYSYYFVTAGFAFLVLVIFNLLAHKIFFKRWIYLLSLNGKNPMVAYVAGNLLLLPILSLTHIKPYWDALNENFFMGLLKGILFTTTVGIITIFFVKRKWFWKT